MPGELKIMFMNKGLIPFWILLFIGLYYFTRFSYRHESNISERIRRTLIWLRTGVWFFLCLALLDPVLNSYFWKTERNKSVVLVDQSLSMLVGDREKKTRFEKVRELLGSDTGSTLEKKLDVRYFLFDSGLIPSDKKNILALREPSGDATDIGNALLNALSLQEQGIRSIILLSDGINNVFNDFSLIEKQLLAKKIKVYSVDLSENENIRDISLQDMDYPEEANANTEIDLTVRVHSFRYPGTSLMLRTYVDDRPVRSEQIRVNEGMNLVRTPVFIKDLGIHKVKVSVDPKEGESILLNNSRTVFIRAMKNKFRVLFLYGTPNFEFKFIRLALDSDPNIELDARVNVNKGFQTVGDLAKYDLIILGDVKYRYLPEPLVQKLLNYADTRSGTLLFLGGRNSFRNGDYHNSKLKEIIPVDWSDSGEVLKSEFNLKLTPLGSAAPFFRLTQDLNKLQEYWNNLPPMNLINVVKSVKKGTQVLAVDSRQENLVLLAIGSYKRTRTGIFTGFPTWKWGFINIGLGYSENPFNIFWQQFVRYLINFNLEKISLFTSKLIYKKDEEIDVKLFLYQEDFNPVLTDRVEVSLSRSVNNEYKLMDRFSLYPSASTPGLYESTLNLKDYGEYRLEAEIKAPRQTVRTFFLITNPEIELYKIEADKDLLKELCRTSGGEFLRYRDFNKLKKLLKEEKTRYWTKVEKNIWENWYFLLLVIGLLTAEWYIRKRNGLL